MPRGSVDMNFLFTLGELQRLVRLYADKQAARYALLLDPLSAAVCSPAELRALFDEMWEAERQYLQPFE